MTLCHTRDAFTCSTVAITTPMFHALTMHGSQFCSQTEMEWTYLNHMTSLVLRNVHMFDILWRLRAVNPVKCDSCDSHSPHFLEQKSTMCQCAILRDYSFCWGTISSCNCRAWWLWSVEDDPKIRGCPPCPPCICWAMSIFDVLFLMWIFHIYMCIYISIVDKRIFWGRPFGFIWKKYWSPKSMRYV